MPFVVAAAKNPILPESKEVIWFTLAFAILFFVMKKYALPPVQEAMEARTEKIRRNLDDADRIKEEAQSVLEDYQRQLADAKQESNRIIEEARQTADQLRRDLMQRAEAEVTELRERTREEIRAAQERATSELQARVAELAIELAEKVVESSLDRDRNMQLIERYIEQVGAQSS